ncbi:hypothetical protein HMSSN139_22050 [Paenibacillus sp. HMSSN-139]|nr:hypothetical protein HMSSN139_22050 [Paenibacillus sp. HMSSN-139]
MTRTSEIEVPALIIHGTEDPIIPYAHGVNLASVIPDSRLLTLEGTGHELHRNDWGVIINEIVDFTSTR